MLGRGAPDTLSKKPSNAAAALPLLAFAVVPAEELPEPLLGWEPGSTGTKAITPLVGAAKARCRPALSLRST
jgi:hypothetical protein